MKHDQDIKRVEELLGDYYCDEHRAAFAVLAEEQDGKAHLGMMNQGPVKLSLRAIARGLSEAIIEYAETDEYYANELGLVFSRMLAEEVRQRIGEKQKPDLTLTTEITDEQKGALLQ